MNSEIFYEICHRQAAILNDSNQNIEFIFWEHNNYHQIGKGYLQYEMTIAKDVAVAANRVRVNGDAIGLVNTALECCFKECKLATTGIGDIKHNKYKGQVSTIVRALTSKDVDLLSHFDETDESEVEIETTSLNHQPFNNHDVAGDKGKIVVQLILEHIFGFCKTFKKIPKQLGFHLTFKTTDLQDINSTTLGDNIKVNFDKLFFFVPKFIPDAQTQIMFNDSFKKSFTLSFDSWSTDRKTVDTQLENQVDIGSVQNINTLKLLVRAHQTAVRVRTTNKANHVAVFDNLKVRKYHFDKYGVRYPRDCVSIDYASNDYFDEYGDLKFFYKEYNSEELVNPFISYPDMKNKNPSQVIDLRFQVDHINPKKIQQCEEYRAGTDNARLFTKIIRHREIRMVSDGNKNTEVTLI